MPYLTGRHILLRLLQEETQQFDLSVLPHLGKPPFVIRDPGAQLVLDHFTCG